MAMTAQRFPHNNSPWPLYFNPITVRSSTLLQRLSITLLGSLLLVICLPAFAASEAPAMSIRQEGNLLIVRGWLKADVDPAIAWAVLTDYEQHPRFVPGIRLSRIVSSSERQTLLEQQGEVLAGSLRVPYGGTMRIDESPMQGMTIVFLSGLFKDVRGEWQLGREKPVKLSYEMRMDLQKTPYPPMMANLLAEQQVKQWVAVFSAEMERRQKNSRSK
jgi:ribosome-associated toxin RatA of RatAB toxin-antitoxin module